MRSLRHAVAALLASLTLAATASEASAQFAMAPAPPAPAPLQVATSPAPMVMPEHKGDPLLAGLFTGLAVLGIADVGFGVYDAVQAGRGVPPGFGASMAELVVASPQVIVLGTMGTVLMPEVSDDDPTSIPLVVVPGIADALFAHGVWANRLPGSSPAVTYGVPWAMGMDMALTMPAISSAFSKRLFPRPLGAMEMVLTAPQIAAASYGIAKEPHAAGWPALTAWSSALFVHGLVSTVVPRKAPVPESSAPPPPPRPPLLVPASIDFGPRPVAGGIAVGVSGRLW